MLTLPMFSMRIETLLIALALQLGGVSTARAQDDVAAAREHFAKGTRAFDLGQYDEAAKEYEAAYKAKDDPALLFNIGQAYRQLGEKVAAVRAYKGYLRRMPDAPNRAVVEARIAELSHAIEEEKRKSPSSPPVAPPTEATPRSQPESIPTTSGGGPSAAPKQSAATPALIAAPPPPARHKRGLAIGLGVGAAVLVVGAVAVGLAIGLSPQPNRLPPAQFQ